MKDKHGSAALMLLLGLLPAAFIISCQSSARDSYEHSRNSTGKIQKEVSARLLPTETPENYMIAFIGDQGPKVNALAVLELIKNEGADAVVHAGDFDYRGNPAAWDARINAILGADFPYFASVGNHDESRFYGSGGYQEFMAARMERLGLTWDGDLGVKSSFVFNGIFFVLTGPDVFGSGHAEYIRDKLAEDNSIWSISNWHKNMRRMQVGGKSDDTGWEVYEESRKGGAIIATGHEHSYSRTHLLSSCQNQTVASTSDTLALSADDPATPEDEGKTFVFVSGLGGKSIRDQELAGDWWASIYTSTQGAKYGALFGVFNYQGRKGLAKFYFKNIDGAVVDEFYVTSPVRDELVSLN
jgi:predicted phosphodiesterase